MAKFNRTFYGLNNERSYCFATAHEKIPPALLSDLKLSVPSFTTTPCVASVLLKGEVVRVVIVDSGQAVAVYSSDNRSMLRAERTYPLKSLKEGYEGVIVFGCLREDVYYTGDTPIAEECLTRYSPSVVPYVSVPCTSIRLTGEVSIGGDQLQTHSCLTTSPSGEPVMSFDLIDTGLVRDDNPMIHFANGINAFNEMSQLRSAIYTIHGVGPSVSGRFQT